MCAQDTLENESNNENSDFQIDRILPQRRARLPTLLHHYKGTFCLLFSEKKHAEISSLEDLDRSFVSDA